MKRTYTRDSHTCWYSTECMICSSGVGVKMADIEENTTIKVTRQIKSSTILWFLMIVHFYVLCKIFIVVVHIHVYWKKRTLQKEQKRNGKKRKKTKLHQHTNRSLWYFSNVVCVVHMSFICFCFKHLFYTMVFIGLFFSSLL